MGSSAARRENVGPLLNGAGDLVIEDMAMAEVVAPFSPHSLLFRLAFRHPRSLENNRKLWSKGGILSGGIKPKAFLSSFC